MNERYLMIAFAVLGVPAMGVAVALMSLAMHYL